MNKFNDFFRRIYSRPSLLWKGIAGLLFLSLAIIILFVPSLTGNLEDKVRYGFAGLLIFYSLFRLGTFYMEYKSYDNE